MESLKKFEYGLKKLKLQLKGQVEQIQKRVLKGSAEDKQV